MQNLKDIILERLIIDKTIKSKSSKLSKSIDEFVEKYQLKDTSTPNNLRFGKYLYEFTVDNDVVSEAIQSNIYDRWDLGSYKDQNKFTTEIEQFGKDNFHWSNVGIDIYIDKDKYISYLCIYETNQNTNLIKMLYRSSHNQLDIILKDDDMKREYESWMIQILEYIINKEDY